MGKLQHGSHECELTSPKIIANGICNICFKDELVEFACDPCNFDLCKTCSDLPQKMSHHLHPEHPLEFRIGKVDRETKYMVCVGCGNMSSGTYYYECSKCEIYLDLSCALQKSIATGWEAKEMLHYSHEHQLKRCRPGPDSRGSCLLCEQPLSFTAICYGCVHCYLFFHERCLDLPTEIQHPVHPMHPLKRLDYIQTFDGRKSCNACEGIFVGVPFGCLECDFYLHLRCADALLRGYPAYSCEECDFLGHTECIIREEVPSPLYLKDLYSCSKGNTRSKNLKDLDTSQLEDRVLVNSFNHIHVMRLIHMSELEEKGNCNIYLGRPSRHQFHLNHSLTLLPNSPRGIKSTYICHPLCIQVGRRILVGHPLHSDHMLAISLESGSKCTACQLQITTKYGYHCSICKINFHIDCIKEVISQRKIKSHSHYLYNFWNNDLRVTRACSVCTRPCGVSFYGCIDSGESVLSVNHPPGDDREEATEEEQLQDIYLMYIERDIRDHLRIQRAL
ncbi:unnamed protein product [Arabidopsis thaliana]|uniref:(thale cress) hypothetical protein n=1 Tax=Arabidopsis thaliana TaxID=3702 RepID=A0A7G2EC84_ARATH|nr:unnamed protein product [Arabidopsis thaliana]